MENKETYIDVKPLFKYVGGKRWLKEILRKNIKNQLIKGNKEGKPFDTYVEPFVGGMGAFLSVYDVLKENGIKTVIINDINTVLINFYRIVNGENGLKSETLLKTFIGLEKTFDTFVPEIVRKLHPLKDKLKIKDFLAKANNFYLEKRTRFNELVVKEKLSNDEIIESSALLMFLQSHCFNGVYRENSKGEYNTPFNWSWKIKNEFHTKNELSDIKKVFKLFNMQIFNKSALEIEYNDEYLYYLDPPYLNEDIEENKYNKDHFGKDEQIKLIELIKDKSFVYSNHKNLTLLNHFGFQKEVEGEGFLENSNYEIEFVLRKNIVSASVESRQDDKEEIVVSSK